MVVNKLTLALAVTTIFFLGTSVAMASKQPAPDFATLIVEMSDTCHKSPASTECQSLIKQIQRGNDWEVLSSDGIYWAEYKG